MEKKGDRVAMVTVARVLPSNGCHCVAMITMQMQGTSCYSVVVATVARVTEQLLE